MTLGNIITKSRFLVNADSNTWSDSQLLLDINEENSDVTVRILKAQTGWDYDDTNNTTLPLLTADLVANQKYYTLPTGTLQVKRIDVSYDGTTYFKAEPFDQGERGQDMENITDFQSTKPYYDLITSDTFQLLPTPANNVSGGLKIQISRAATDFTSSQFSAGTVSPGFDSLFHQILAYGPAYRYALAKGLPNTQLLFQQYQLLQQDLENYYGGKDVDREIILKPFYQDYGDYVL